MNVLVFRLALGRMDVRVVVAIVAVGMHVIGTAPPANEQAGGEQDDDQADQRLRGLLDDMGQEATEEQHRKTEEEQCGCVTESPRSAETSRCAAGTAGGVGCCAAT